MYQSNVFLDIISELELGKPGDRRKPEKRVNGVFWIILLNLGIYVADLVSGALFIFFWLHSLFDTDGDFP